MASLASSRLALTLQTEAKLSVFLQAIFNASGFRKGSTTEQALHCAPAWNVVQVKTAIYTYNMTYPHA